MAKRSPDFGPWLEAIGAAAQRLSLRAAKLQMQKIVSEQLSKSSADIYLSGISDIQITEDKITYTLDDAALRLEGNAGPWDMKPKLLAAATKMSAAGTRFIDIPFRKSSPRRRHPRRFAAVPSDVDQIMRELQDEAGGAEVRSPSGMFRETAVSKLVVMPEGGTSENTSKAGYFEDIIRFEKGSPKEDGDYQTIRRVSENSAPDSWIYPAREGVHMQAQLQQFMDANINKIVELAAKEVLNGNGPRKRRA